MPTFYDSDNERLRAKYYSFDFTIDEELCSAWYDPEKHEICFNCGHADVAESLLKFVMGLQMFIYAHAADWCMDQIELERFALKHLRKEVKIKRLLDKIP
jgi:hypothetical protein